MGNGIADNDGQGIEKGETITIDLSNNPVGSVNLGLDGLGGLFDYGQIPEKPCRKTRLFSF